MGVVEELDNILASVDNQKHCLKGVVCWIHCHLFAVLPCFGGHEGVLDKEMQSMRTAAMEVAGWELLLQQLPCLLVCGGGNCYCTCKHC